MFSDCKRLDSLIKVFRGKNLVYYENNALFLSTEVSSDRKDRVLIKSNGEFTYFLSDILYHLDKMNRADLLINIWGSDHHGYVERLRSALRMLGYNDQEKLVVILIQMVALLEGKEHKKFSKRAGTVIEIEEALSMIGKDQLRFCLLEKEVGHTININLFLLKEQKERSRLYYLQYAHARCCQLILRARRFSLYENDPFGQNSFLLKVEKERSILKNLVRFESIICSVIAEKKPSIIIQYLQTLAKEFQTYYQSYQIVDDSNHELTRQRIFLVSVIKKVLGKGLALCGIEAPSLMENMGS